jgi:hypothetical protein
MIEINTGESRPWEPPDGLGYSRLREVRLTGGGVAILALAGLMAVGGLVAGIALNAQANRESETSRLLQQGGVHADATVTRRWKSGGKDAQGWASYQFTYEGAIYEKRVKPPRRIWTNLSVGESLGIRFLPSNPAVSHPEDWSDRPTPVWVPYLVGALLIRPAGFLVLAVRRQSRLLAEGHPAQGAVTRHTRADHGKTRNHYEFRMLSGAVAKGSTAGRNAIAIGAPVCIIYDPDNPRRNAIYPLPFVRLANVRKAKAPPQSQPGR